MLSYTQIETEDCRIFPIISEDHRKLTENFGTFLEVLRILSETFVGIGIPNTLQQNIFYTNLDPLARSHVITHFSASVQGTSHQELHQS